MKLSTALIFVFFVLALGITSKSEEITRPEEAEPQSQKPQLNESIPKEKEREVQPSQGKPPTNEPNAKHPAHDQENNTNRPIDYQWWFNLLLIILTGGLVAVGALQFCVYKRQARYMRIGLRLTGKAANAAKKSADTAERSLNLTERAYLHLDYSRLSQEKIIGSQTTGEMNVTCYFHNFGRTQGILITGYTDIFTSKDTPEIPNYASHPNIWTGTEIIPPTGDAQYPASIYLKASELEAIKNRSTILFFYGYFTYRDVFCREQKIAFFTQYDIERGGFFKVHRSGYNYST